VRQWYSVQQACEPSALSGQRKTAQCLHFNQVKTRFLFSPGRNGRIEQDTHWRRSPSLPTCTGVHKVGSASRGFLKAVDACSLLTRRFLPASATRSRNSGSINFCANKATKRLVVSVSESLDLNRQSTGLHAGYLFVSLLPPGSVSSKQEHRKQEHRVLILTLVVCR